MSLQMVSEICGDENDPKWDEAVVAAEKALTVSQRSDKSYRKVRKHL